MSKSTDILYRHAQYYQKRLETLDNWYEREKGIEEVYQQLDTDWLQMFQAGRWLLNHETSSRHAKLFRDYCQYGANLLELQLSQPEYVLWLERGLASAKIEGDSHLELVFTANLTLPSFRIGKSEQAKDYANLALELSSLPSEKMTALNSLGIISNAKGDFPAALGFHKQGLRLALEMHDREEIFSTLINIAVEYHSMRKNELAWHLIHTCLQYFLKTENLSTQNTCYHLITNILIDRQEYAQAIDKCHQMLEIAVRNHDKASEAQVFGTLGNIYHHLGSYNLAIDYIKKSLEFSMATGNRWVMLPDLMNLSMVYFDIGNMDYAKTYAQATYDIAKLHESPDSQKDALHNLAIIATETQDYAMAEDYYQEIFALEDNYNFQSDEGILSDYALLLVELGNVPEALEFYQKALQKALLADNQSVINNCLGNMGIAYRELGDDEKALSYYHQAWEISSQAQAIPPQIKDLINLVTLLYKLDEYEKALTYALKARSLCESVADKQHLLIVLDILGDLYYYIDDYENAENTYHFALDISQELKDHKATAKQYDNLGDVFTALENFDDAHHHYIIAIKLTYQCDLFADCRIYLTDLAELYGYFEYESQMRLCYSLAVSVSRRLHDSDTLVSDLCELSLSYLNLGHYESSIEISTEALFICKANNNASFERQSLSYLAISLEKVGQLDEAIKNHSKALAISQRINEQESIGADLWNLGILHRIMGKLDSALSYFEDAKIVYESLDDAHMLQHCRDVLDEIRAQM